MSSWFFIGKKFDSVVASFEDADLKYLVCIVILVRIKLAGLTPKEADMFETKKRMKNNKES